MTPRAVPHALLGALVVLVLVGMRTDARPTPVLVDPAPPAPTGPAPRTEEAPLTGVATMRRTTVGGKVMSYCGNGSVDAPPAQTTRVIVMIHGNDRLACGAARSVLAGASPDQTSHTLVVAPAFPVAEDGVNAGTDLHWTFYGWSQGDAAINRDAPVSSYAVVDALLERAQIPDRVVAGFSGGGQFVSRYAAGTALEATRFVVANPSSYLYFTPDRPGGDPALITRCPRYDTYRYGLAGLNPYMQQAGPDELKRRFARREIVWLLGDADNDPRSPSMDTDCGAMAQGPNRYERGRRYWAYLPTVFGGQILRTHSTHVVPGVAHNSPGMMGSPAARQALFS